MEISLSDKMGKESLVCCLDILGYKTLVNEYSTKISKRDAIPRIFQRITTVLKKLKAGTDRSYKQLLQGVQIQNISDTMIIVWDLGCVTGANNKILSECFERFFRIVSGYFVYFPKDIGYFLRGGITIGRYYQSCIGGEERNQFIFSEAFNEAHELGQRADWPRILLSASVNNYIEKKPGIKEPIKNWIFTDSDGQLCLESYLFLKSPFDYSHLRNIKSVVEKQITKNKDDSKILGKYCLFAQYHNAFVRKNNVKNDAVISIDESLAAGPINEKKVPGTK